MAGNGGEAEDYHLLTLGILIEMKQKQGRCGALQRPLFPEANTEDG